MKRDEILNKACGALSMACRYGGDVRRFYSVAEHTVHQVRQARRSGESSATLLRIWLHDLPEYITGDGLPIMKSDDNIRPHWIAKERGVMLWLANDLGLPAKFCMSALECEIMQKYDMAILAAESAFVANPQPGWMPYDPDDVLHVAFGVRLQRSAPFCAHFAYWSAAMVNEFLLITETLTGEDLGG